VLVDTNLIIHVQGKPTGMFKAYRHLRARELTMRTLEQSAANVGFELVILVSVRRSE
tara:strand:- start:4747 stop:4917 length:171 start_codon:yes stop_codon:yes gene_type:complete